MLDYTGGAWSDFSSLENIFCKEKIFINFQVQRYTHIEAIIPCQVQGCVNFAILFVLPTIVYTLNSAILGMIACGLFEIWSDISHGLVCVNSSSVAVVISCISASFLFHVLFICFIVLRYWDYFLSAFQSHFPNMSRFLTIKWFLGGAVVFLLVVIVVRCGL